MTRHAALDLARGMAVLGMVYMHLVGSRLANALEGKSAALFCLLAGITWALQKSGSVARRALALFVFGALFHYLVWPTEVLVPLALMMVLTHGLRRAGQKALWIALVLALAAAPVTVALFGSLITSDWRDDGSHLADQTLGWASVRALLFDGSYPLVPWLAFPLAGALAVQRGVLVAPQRTFWGALLLATLAQLYASRSSPTAHASLQATWVPTTLPFVLLIGSPAAALIAGLVWWERARGLPRLANPLALVGRASLTHYVLHIVAVFVPLRLLYPAEDWPARTGLLAFLGYWALALPLTVLWFRRFPRGPLESVWNRVG